MARPVDLEKRADLGRRALDALQQLGLEASMTQLADAVGVKRPTLLYHFPSRSAIVEAALTELLTEQAIFVMAQMDRHPHPVDALFVQILAVHAFQAGREPRVMFLTQAIAAGGDERTERIIQIGNQAMEARRQLMGRRCRDAIAAGEMVECDVGSLIRVVRGFIDGLVVQRVMTGCDLAPIHDFIWERVLGPLKLPPGAPRPTL